MADQERAQAASAALESAINQICATYGVTVTVRLIDKRMGEAMLIEPGILVNPIPNWQSPQETEKKS